VKVAHPPPNFGWLIPRKLAGSGMLVEGNIEWLLSHGITAVISLEAIDDACKALLEAEGIRHLFVPVPDFCGPSVEELHTITDFMVREISSGGIVLVHCGAGKGRTGTVLAAYMIRTGLGLGEAIAEVRRKRPGSIQSRDQEDALRRYWSLQISADH